MTGIESPAHTKPEFVSRPRESERTTRKPLGFWDRIKFLFLLTVIFWLLVWFETIDNPILPFNDAVNRVIESNWWWLFTLGGLELVRQLNYLVLEHSKSYYRVWRAFWKGFDNLVEKVNPWTRFRLARLTKWICALLLLNGFVAWRTGEDFFTQLPKLPQTIVDFLLDTGGQMPLIFSLVFALVFILVQFAAMFWFVGRGGTEVYYPDDIPTRFTDIWGQDPVLEKVKENLIFLEHPKAIESKGGYVPGGVLLYGPPGTGKTLIAEAVAGETGFPYIFVEPGAFSAMFMGVGVMKVRNLFKKLRKLALKYGGVIVFFDEADSLGKRGFGGAGGAGGMASPATGDAAWDPQCNVNHYLSEGTRSLLWQEHLAATAPEEPEPSGKRRFVMGMGMNGGGDTLALQALLAEMNGLKKPRGFLNRFVRRLLGMHPKLPPRYRILVVMATNMPDSLDRALLRPGRIDRIYKVGYPSKEGRRRTFDGYFAKVKHDLSDEQIDRLATMSPYATGAMIKDTVNEALVFAIRDGRDTITWPDVLKAKHHKQHGVPDDDQYIDRERHAVAIHEACHAIAFYRLDRNMAIDVATIERRGDVGGFVAPIPLEDQKFTWKSHREIDIMISVASLAGERMFFDGDNSAGVGGDLASATTVAMQMEAFHGMGSTIASHRVTKAEGAAQIGQSVETGTDRMWLETPFGQRVEARLQELTERVRQMLEKDRIWVLALAHAMERHHTVSGEDIQAIMIGTRGPTVDGAQYHDPAFQRKLEEYHRAAVDAHRETAAVVIPLPGTETQAELAGAAAVSAAVERPEQAPPGS